MVGNRDATRDGKYLKRSWIKQDSSGDAHLFVFGILFEFNAMLHIYGC